MKKEMKVLGALILGYATACINLKFIAGKDVQKLISNIIPNQWYPLDLLIELGTIVTESYDDPGPIMEKAGEEMMKGWYHNGPGKEIIKDNGVVSAIPVVEVNHPKAHITHEAALGSVDSKQLQTLMARGLNENRATDLIIQGLLS